MFCTKCGNEYKSTDKFCGNCGQNFSETVSSDSKSTNQNYSDSPVSEGGVKKSIIDGRMTRKEFAAMTIVPYLVLLVLAFVAEEINESWFYYLVIPLVIYWFIFGYFASIRRLHDLNKSAWWLLVIVFAGLTITVRESLELIGVDTFAFDTTIIGFLINIVAIVGMVVFLSLLFWPGTKGTNKYGEVTSKRKLDVRNVFYNLQSPNEKLDLTYILWTVGVVAALAGLVFIYFINENDNTLSAVKQPNQISEFLGISLGADRVDVTLLKGNPTDEIKRENSTRLIYKDVAGLIESVVDLDENNKVKRICTEEFMYKVYDLGEYSTLQQVQSTLGEAPEVSISSDGTMMITTYPERNVAFVFSRNQVTTTCVTSEDKISFTEEYQNN